MLGAVVRLPGDRTKVVAGGDPSSRHEVLQCSRGYSGARWAGLTAVSTTCIRGLHRLHWLVPAAQGLLSVRKRPLHSSCRLPIRWDQQRLLAEGLARTLVPGATALGGMGDSTAAPGMSDAVSLMACVEECPYGWQRGLVRSPSLTASASGELCCFALIVAVDATRSRAVVSWRGRGWRSRVRASGILGRRRVLSGAVSERLRDSL